jgi:cell division protein FtsW (lipid II flippase)
MQSKVTGLAGTALVCIFGFVLSALLLMYAASPWIDHNEIPFFGTRLHDTAIFFVLGASGVAITVGLARGRRWAWWSALIVVSLLLSMAVFLLVATVRPRDDFARSEGGFGWFLSFCLLVPGVISAVLLSLPAVRRRFSRPSDLPERTEADV